MGGVGGRVGWGGEKEREMQDGEEDGRNSVGWWEG